MLLVSQEVHILSIVNCKILGEAPPLHQNRQWCIINVKFYICRAIIDDNRKLVLCKKSLKVKTREPL